MRLASLGAAKPKKLTAYAIGAINGNNSNSKKTHSPEKKKSPNKNSGSKDGDMSLPGDLGEMHFLVKQEAKGDLRKDARVQDFNNVVNRLLAR